MTPGKHHCFHQTSRKPRIETYLSHAQLRCLCDSGTPLLPCSSGCRQCWIQRFSTLSSELLRNPWRGFWETWRGFPRWPRRPPSPRRSLRWRTPARCCHWSSRSLRWSSSPFLAPWRRRDLELWSRSLRKKQSHKDKKKMKRGGCRLL